MSDHDESKRFTDADIKKAFQKEQSKFAEHFQWLENHMPHRFFDEIDADSILLVAHNLMYLDQQDYFCHIHFRSSAIVLSLDSPDADMRILHYFRDKTVKNYRAFVSNTPPLFSGTKQHLRITIIHFATLYDYEDSSVASTISKVYQEQIHTILRQRNPKVTDEDFHRLIAGMTARFERAMPRERLVVALDMFFRAQNWDECQYEVQRIENWKDKKDSPSLQIIFAWRNVPQRNFLFRLARLIHRHGLSMNKVNATVTDPHKKDSILIMSLGLHGSHGKAAWEEADIDDLIQELVTLKYFEDFEEIETNFVDTGLISGNLGNLLKAMCYFVHQTLVALDPNIYTLAHIEEALLRHPQLTQMITKAFSTRFAPEQQNAAEYEKIRQEYLRLVAQLDTGNEAIDTRRKNVLGQMINMVHYTLKTNFYQMNKTAFGFRLDPAYLNEVPYERKDKFPEIPYAIFFFKGMHYLGFHIRFKDLSRGGLRTVLVQRPEQVISERNNVFSECYNLAYTQQKKNKDIPEGGAKGVIFLQPYERLAWERDIYKKELQQTHLAEEDIEKRLDAFTAEQKLDFLYQAQKSYVSTLITLVNCLSNGKLKTEQIIDYYKRPEYIYLGPDENMHNVMIEWIANYSIKQDYKPKGSFISSKPGAGINHKEYGVTSYGVNVYMEEVLKFLGIDPTKDTFTIKISGGPDGDVAGNQIYNLYKFYPKTAKLLAITDVSGTIYDPQGLDLAILVQLFKEEKPLRFYPPEKLQEGGFLLDLRTKREQTSYASQTLCYRRKGGKVIEDWLNGNEMNHLFRTNLHQTCTDVFIPGGGRPRTLNDTNYKEYLDETGKPTSRAIVEGANLYLTPFARRSLEKLGVIIIKDSSANKGGVICSSFEVLAGLCMDEEEFIANKQAIMTEVLAIIRKRAVDEAKLLLKTYQETNQYLTDISDKISERINAYTYEILDHLENEHLSYALDDAYTRCLLKYAPPLLRTKYRQQLIASVPDIHKKAIIACHIASRLVYDKGLAWSPNVVDILPLIAEDPSICGGA